MKIYDENMELIENPDLSIGYLKEGVKIEHHEAIEEVKEISHYEVVMEYPNGGKDIKKIIDVPGIEFKEAWDEEIAIQLYVLYSNEELQEIENQKNTPSQLDIIEAQVTYTAMMTDTLLEV